MTRVTGNATQTERSAASDGRDDRHGDAVVDLGRETVEVAHVVVVDEHVDELAQAAVFVDQAIGQTRMRRLERCNDVGERAGLDGDLLVATREGAHGGGDANGHCHARHATGEFLTRVVDNHGHGQLAIVDSVSIRRVVAAPDKFKGTLTAAEAAAAIGHACWELGIDCTEIPMADGGDGLLDVLGGANRTSVVTGPLGDPVAAPWRLAKGTAVIEMARASGLTIVGGPEGNDAMTATTTGTGELIDHALDAGARRIIVGLGGSATTDGGFGAIRAITAISRLKRVELLVACDVTTTFVDAARVFGPQKGASRAQIDMLTRRLERLTQMFEHEFQADVTTVAGGGAAGGLGGALAALGATLLPGFELVADELDLYDHLEGADLVITGEGCLDDTSSAGKVVGGIASIAAEADVACLAVVGSDERSDRATPAGIDVISLTDDYGRADALAEPKRLIEDATARWLSTQR